MPEALSADIFFAHSYHPRERGLGEHANGLIRQYLPKKAPFAALTQKQLDKIVYKINNRHVYASPPAGGSVLVRSFATRMYCGERSIPTPKFRRILPFMSTDSHGKNGQAYVVLER
jgi:hypothetical protein